jgi:putative endonuclease
MFFVHLLKSDKDGTYYIGQTQDLAERLKRHNAGLVYYTSRKIPFQIVYHEAYLNREQAQEREQQLKRFGSAYAGLMKRLGYK